MINIHPRGKKRILYLDYYYKGKRIQKSTGTTNLSFARAEAAKLEYDLFMNKLEPARKSKAETAINLFFRRYHSFCMTTKSKRTYDSEEHRLKFWEDYLYSMGMTKLDQITPGIIQVCQAQILKYQAPRTWNNTLNVLKAALNRAVEWQLLERNPIANIKPLKIAKKFHVFADEEVEQMLDQATPGLKAAILLGAFAGLRHGETIALRWKDIDFRNKTISIRSDQEFTPKSKKPRIIPMSARLYRELVSIKAGIQGKRRGPCDISDNSYNRLTKSFIKLRKSLRFKGRLHDLRHTFASNLVSKGATLYIVSELLGHSDYRSSQIYAHLAPSALAEAVKLLDTD